MPGDIAFIKHKIFIFQVISLWINCLKTESQLQFKQPQVRIFDLDINLHLKFISKNWIFDLHNLCFHGKKHLLLNCEPKTDGPFSFFEIGFPI